MQVRLAATIDRSLCFNLFELKFHDSVNSAELASVLDILNVRSKNWANITSDSLVQLQK